MANCKHCSHNNWLILKEGTSFPACLGYLGMRETVHHKVLLSTQECLPCRMKGDADILELTANSAEPCGLTTPVQKPHTWVCIVLQLSEWSLSLRMRILNWVKSEIHVLIFRHAINCLAVYFRSCFANHWILLTFINTIENWPLWSSSGNMQNSRTSAFEFWSPRNFFTFFYKSFQHN